MHVICSDQIETLEHRQYSSRLECRQEVFGAYTTLVEHADALPTTFRALCMIIRLT
jgi:hypothetical protein